MATDGIGCKAAGISVYCMWAGVTYGTIDGYIGCMQEPNNISSWLRREIGNYVVYGGLYDHEDINKIKLSQDK